MTEKAFFVNNLLYFLRRIKMDSKIVVDNRLADLILKTETVVSVIADIPGASIVSDNVELDLSKFGEGASVVIAKCNDETATVSVSGTTATLDFTSAVAATDVLEVSVKLDI
jgi:hypothetical protein